MPCLMLPCELTDCLLELLRESEHILNSVTKREIVRGIKEKLFYVALDFEQEMATAATNLSLKRSL